MARVSKRWRLNLYVEPTPVRPSRAEIAEALYALQVGSPDEAPELLGSLVDQIMDSPLAGVLVAVVKHMAQQSGRYLAIDLDAAPGDPMDDPSVGRPTIEDVTYTRE